MTTKRSMILLLAVILISITFMTTYYIDKKSPTVSTSGLNEDGPDFLTDELGADHIRDELKIAVSMDTLEYLELVSLSLEFEAYNPGVKVAVELVEKEEAYQYYKKASQMGDAPDIMLLDNAWVSEFAALSYLAQLDEDLTSNMNELQIAPMVSQVKWNGFLWAVPKEIDPYVVVWNDDRFVEHDITELPQTIDDILSLNRLLTNSELGQLGFHIDFNDPYAFISLAWMLGEHLIEGEDQPFTLNDEVILDRLNSLLFPTLVKFDAKSALVKNGEVKIEEMTKDPDKVETNNSVNELQSFDKAWASSDYDPWALLNDGTIAMMLTTVSQFNKHAEDHIKLAALPLYHDASNVVSKPDGGWLYGKSFAVSSKSILKKEAFDWIQSITTMDAQVKLMEAGGGLPAMISAYSERLSGISYYEQIVKSIEHGQVFQAQPELSIKLNELHDAIRELGLNDISVPEFIERFDIAWQDIISIQ